MREREKYKTLYLLIYRIYTEICIFKYNYLKEKTYKEFRYTNIKLN